MCFYVSVCVTAVVCGCGPCIFSHGEIYFDLDLDLKRPNCVSFHLTMGSESSADETTRDILGKTFCFICPFFVHFGIHIVIKK